MADAPRLKELPVGKLRWKCPGKYLDFKTTNDIKPCTDIIGQDRALHAIKMGLELEHRGYNIFITGLVGTGRTSTLPSLTMDVPSGSSVDSAQALTTSILRLVSNVVCP